MNGNYLYFEAYGTDAYPLKKDNEGGYHMCRYDIVNDEFVILYDGYDEASFGALYVTENEDIVMLRYYYNEWNEDTSVSEIRLKKSVYGNDGEEKEDIVISELGLDVNDAAYVGVRECKFDDKGNIYVVYEYDDVYSGFDICMYDGKGILKNRVQMRDKLFYSMAVDDTGRPVVCCGGNVNNSGYCECIYPDFEGEKPGEVLEGLSAGNNIFSRCELIDSYGSIPFFISDGTLLYKYDREDKKPKAVLNWLNTGILYDDLYYIRQFDEKRLFCMAGDSMGFLDNSGNVPDERKVLRLASLRETGDIDVQNMIIDYNIRKNKLKIKL